MEKLVTLLWKPEAQSSQAFADLLLTKLAVELQAGSRGLKICVSDDDTAAGESLIMSTTKQPKAAMLSYWLDMSQQHEQMEKLLAPHCDALATFLVVESTPIINTKQQAALGKRTPGFAQITCVQARQDLAYEEFLRIWHYEHMACAIETQSTFQYIRNEIVRRLSGDIELPDWTAVVEEGFPVGALSNPQVFYDAEGDEKKFQANLNRMMTTVQKFLEMETIDVSAMSEYIFERL